MKRQDSHKDGRPYKTVDSSQNGDKNNKRKSIINRIFIIKRRNESLLYTHILPSKTEQQQQQLKGERKVRFFFLKYVGQAAVRYNRRPL
jgi:hypothetical protein